MGWRYKTLQEQLDRHKKIDPETGCWLWTGAKIGGKRGGHGTFQWHYKCYLVHRVAMHVYKGFDLASSALICHVRRCPNAHCFNPEHLYVGNQSSNLRDAFALGTTSFGNQVKKKV